MNDRGDKEVTIDRRTWLRGGLAAGAALAASTLAGKASAGPQTLPGAEDLIASPPAGFTPLKLPGRVVKVTRGTSFPALMQPNLLWPKPEVARQMLERAMTDLTGAPNMIDSMKRFIHPDDVVAIKVNGIAGSNMSVAWELILPVVEAVIGVGVAPSRITVYEQFPNFLSSTRVGLQGNALPSGVLARYHSNQLSRMRDVEVVRGVPTRYARFLTDATALINLALIKDHSICGYTGLLKNITHGSIVNPSAHHGNHANPQIALLFGHPIVQSRVRLHITDGFKLNYDGGPLDKKPQCRIPHGAVYVTTDAVAMDTVGWQVVEQARRDHGIKSLTEAGRAPAYLQTAADLRVGTYDLNAIRLQSTSL
ncbi:MAG: DUF362 domain-containing protein [Deltaproteobacteria bacterium]|nr:DUF362 domain-containing protein [Deltaproteobacteria bacterium]